MLRIFLLIFICFFSIFASANEYNQGVANIDKIIIFELDEYFKEEQKLNKFENQTIKIAITYPQQKNHDLNSLPIKKFELRDVNAKRHEFSGVIHLDDPTEGKINLSGKYQILISLPVLKVKLPKGHVISAMDLEEKFFNSEIISSAFITSKEELIGMTLKKMLKADTVIKKEFITSAIIVKKNDVISLEHNRGKVTLKVLVTALDAGSVGDFIKVKNAKTKQVMYAEIIDERTVKLKLN